MIRTCRLALAGLCIYKNLGKDPILQLLASVLDQLLLEDGDVVKTTEQYGELAYRLFAKGSSFREYLLDLILHDDNPFSREAETRAIPEMSPELLEAVKNDLRRLQQLYWMDFGILQQHTGTAECMPIQLPKSCTNELMLYLDRCPDWGKELEKLTAYHAVNCRGVVSRYQAFRFIPKNGLVGIEDPDRPEMHSLIGCERQKQELCWNTEIFLDGYPANNVLLYGSRGTGKSTMIKSLLNRYQDRKLCMVEMSREDAAHLPDLFKQLREYNRRFIVYIDDLSFEEYETEYKGLKAVLEGSLAQTAPNVLIYATSNRRHLVKEFFSDRGRAGEEVHTMDTLQEKLSLADRFGLMITFETPGKDTYLEIIDHLVKERGIEIEPELLQRKALEWERSHHGPSGRTARQFVDSLGNGKL